MPKASLTLPDGSKVTIEGTPKAVAAVLRKVSASGGPTQTKTGKPKPPEKRKSSQPKGPVGHILILKKEGFFKRKRTIGNIQRKLEEEGYIYAQTSLSPALTRLTRSRVLGRIKEGHTYKYVQR